METLTERTEGPIVAAPPESRGEAESATWVREMVPGTAEVPSGRTSWFFSAPLLKRFLLTGDILLILGAIAATEWLIGGSTGSGPVIRAIIILVASVLGTYVVEGYAAYLYRGEQNIVLRVVLGAAIAGSILAMISLAGPWLGLNRRILTIYFVIYLPPMLLWRGAGVRLLRSHLPKRRVIVVGAGAAGLHLIRRFRSSDEFDVVGVLDDDASLHGADVLGVPIDGGSTNLPGLLLGRNVDLVSVAITHEKSRTLIESLLACRYLGIEVRDMATSYELLDASLPVAHLNAGWLAFSSGFSGHNTGWEAKVKRAFDISVAVVGLLVFMPLILLIALGILIDSGRPILYRQNRMGLHSRVFTLYKFRSMSEDAEQEGQAVWAQQADPRATRLGKVLRKTHLDELPQLWNVLRGDMSIVGPRPERPEFVGTLRKEIPYYDLRHMGKPGITGWAQVRYPYGASLDDSTRKLEYDLYYLRNQNLLWDIRIVLKTIAVSLTGRGSR